MMQIAVALYDRFTALDAVGPYEVLSRLPDSKLTFVGSSSARRSATQGRSASASS